MSAVATAEGLKALYERELRYEVGNLGLGSEERRGFWQLLSASRHMRPGEFHEQDHAEVWLWSDLHLGHAMTLSVFGRPYETPDEMDDALFGTWRRVVEPDDTVVILGDVAVNPFIFQHFTRSPQKRGSRGDGCRTQPQSNSSQNRASQQRRLSAMFANVPMSRSSQRRTNRRAARDPIDPVNC